MTNRLFRKKPVVIEATQWHKHGDHQAVVCLPAGHPIDNHAIDPSAFGWVPTLEGGHVVTPGDWIITGVKGEHYPCKPDIFAATYEPASAQPEQAQEAIPEELVCPKCDEGFVLGSRVWLACSKCHGSGRTDRLGDYVPGTLRKKDKTEAETSATASMAGLTCCVCRKPIEGTAQGEVDHNGARLYHAHCKPPPSVAGLSSDPLGVPASPSGSTLQPSVSAAIPNAGYAQRLWCHCRTNGYGEHGCTDCLNTGLDPMAMTGGIEQALNDAYAEGRKDEREAWITAPQPLKDQA